MKMADRIKEGRMKMGYTQEELAHKLGLQKSAIAKYENGRVENMKRSTISKMAKALECTPAYLMGWEEDIVWDKTSSGALDIGKELEGLISRMAACHEIRFFGEEISASSRDVLNSSIESIVKTLEILEGRTDI